MNNDIDIDELKRLHAAATPGEWEATRYSNYAGWSIYAPNGAGCIAERWYSTGQQDEIPRNDLWIVAAHNAFPALIARLEAAEAAMQWRPIEEAHEDWGVCVFINIHEPEPICASTMDDDFAETAKHYGWTHFRRITLTNEDAAALLAALPAPPEAAR